MAIISITCVKLTIQKKKKWFWSWPWNRLMMREKPSQKFKYLSQANIIIDKLKGLIPRRDDSLVLGLSQQKGYSDQHLHISSYLFLSENVQKAERITLALGLPLPSTGMRGKENMLTIFFQNIILVLEYQLIECLCSDEKFWVEIGQKKFV